MTTDNETKAAGGGNAFHFGTGGNDGFWSSASTSNGSSNGRSTSGSRGNGGGNSNGGGRSTSGSSGKGGGKGKAYSPLADPEFFTNADVRQYCETARGGLMQLAFEIAMAAEVLEAVLREIPDPEGKPWGSRLRARRVAKRLAKTGDALVAAAKNSAATYAAFQREFSPELEPVRAKAKPRRAFTFTPDA